MWNTHRACETTRAALLAENSDLRQQVRFLTQQAAQRESGLIDRILAVSHPAAVRELKYEGPRKEVSTAPFQAETPEGQGRPRGINFPGQGMTPPPLPRPAAVGPPPMQGSAEAARRVHTPEDGGSSPSPATTFQRHVDEDSPTEELIRSAVADLPEEPEGA